MSFAVTAKRGNNRCLSGGSYVYIIINQSPNEDLKSSCAFMQIKNMETLLHAMTETKTHEQFGQSCSSKNSISPPLSDYLTVLTVRSTESDMTK